MADDMVRVRVGLLGAANITRLVWTSIHRTGHQVTLLRCRDAERGATFLKEMCAALCIPDLKAPRVSSYDEVVSSPDVDVVFLPIPVTARDEWVEKCVQNGKHVVGEKPPAVTAERLRNWVESLDAKELLYMDGTMLSHGKRVSEVVAAAKSLGMLKHMHSNHCLKPTDEFYREDIRMDPSLEPHGVVGDLGWYSIRYFLHVMGLRMPAEVTGRILRVGGEKEAIIEFSGELTFNVDNNITVASMYAAFGSMDEETLTVAGTEGVLRVKDMCHPISGRNASWTVTKERTVVRGCRRDVEREVHAYSTDEQTETQRDILWEDVGRILYRDGTGKLLARKEPRRYWATLAWKTQAVMDRMIESARYNS